MHWEQSLRIVSSKRNPPLNLNLSMTGNYKCSNTYIELTLIISDFEFASPKASIQKEIIKAQSQGTKFYGLRLGCGDYYGMYYERAYEKLLDKMWVVNV